MAAETSDDLTRLTAAAARRARSRPARCPPSRSPRRTSTGSPRSTDGPRVPARRRRGALAAAARGRRARAAGEPLGPLAGVPLALKDVLHDRGMPTTCGSKILEGWRPPYDATVVAAAARRPGVIVLGKTNMDEFAMGSSTENSALRPDAQPVGPRAASPAARRGGSAAAVAAFEAPLGDRHRHRRLDPPAGRRHRHRRRQADLRRRLPLRPGRLRLLAGQAGPAGPHGARCGAAARGHRRARPAATRPRSTRRCRRSSRPRGTRDVAGMRIGVVKRARRRGLPARRAGPVPRGGRAARVARRRGRRGVLPALRATRCRPTT